MGHRIWCYTGSAVQQWCVSDQFHVCALNTSLITYSFKQSVAHTDPESRTQRAEELYAASPTPRTRPTPPPPSPPPITLPLLSPPTPLVPHLLTTVSAPPPPGPCSHPVVWGPRWPRQRRAPEPGRRASGWGWAAAHRATPRGAIGENRTLARGHSSWFCMAATSSWCDDKEEWNSSRRLFERKRVCLKGRRESDGLKGGTPQCPPPSSPGPVEAESYETEKGLEIWHWGTQQQMVGGQGLAEDGKVEKSEEKRHSKLIAVWPLQEHQGSISGARGGEGRDGRLDTIKRKKTEKKNPAKPNLTAPLLYFLACGQVVKATQKKCSHTD